MAVEDLKTGQSTRFEISPNRALDENNNNGQWAMKKNGTEDVVKFGFAYLIHGSYADVPCVLIFVMNMF